jgi:hypothetical protein
MSVRDIVQAAAGASPATYIEDVFSTYLYTGNGSTQTITNGIDLTGKGGLTWVKNRTNATDNALFNLPSGGYATIAYQASNATNASITTSPTTSITTTGSGFTLNGSSTVINASSTNYASWTFRKQPKFFDVVTYTGNGSAQNIPHNLGSVPGCIIVKRTDSAGDWSVWHKDASTLYLNSTAAQGFNIFGSVTSTAFGVTSISYLNASGGTFVAYIFAHNAGGFGLTGTDNVISCGSFTTDGSGNATVTLGYEPQWVMVKSSSAIDGWVMLDVARGWSMATNDQYLSANIASAESVLTGGNPTATGFVTPTLQGGTTYIYIAIRRPNKPPTTGTQVYSMIDQTGVDAPSFPVSTIGFQPDLVMQLNKGVISPHYGRSFKTRLTGYGFADTPTSSFATSPHLATHVTSAEGSYAWNTNGTVFGMGNTWNANGPSFYAITAHFFKRAPGVFDVVCYTATGSTVMTITHNLTVTPELMIMKARSSSGWNWAVYAASQGATKKGLLNSTNAFGLSTPMWNNTAPTSTSFTVGTGDDTNPSAGVTMVAYLFASCPGVSKVGSYTGNGSTQTINCGFTSGTRFVLIKRADSTGDWFVWDTVRGIVAATDPHLSLNNTTAEVTTDDSIDPDALGFIVNQVAATNINVNAATYIFLAIA